MSLQLIANEGVLVGGTFTDQRGNESIIGIVQAEAPSRFETMTDDITREELNAKLELVETRMDARVERIESKIERLVEITIEARTEASGSRKDFRNWSLGVIVTDVLATLASVIGVWQIVFSVNQGTIAAIE